MKLSKLNKVAGQYYEKALNLRFMSFINGNSLNLKSGTSFCSFKNLRPNSPVYH